MTRGGGGRGRRAPGSHRDHRAEGRSSSAGSRPRVTRRLQEPRLAAAAPPRISAGGGEIRRSHRPRRRSRDRPRGCSRSRSWGSRAAARRTRGAGAVASSSIARRRWLSWFDLSRFGSFWPRSPGLGPARGTYRSTPLTGGSVINARAARVGAEWAPMGAGSAGSIIMHPNGRSVKLTAEGCPNLQRVRCACLVDSHLATDGSSTLG
jgi:hypothetical protein